MKVMKFGGTSVQNAQRIREVGRIIAAEDSTDGLVVVCSAMKGVTDDLIAVARTAASLGTGYETILAAIQSRHHGVVFELLSEPKAAVFWRELENQMTELAEMVQGIALIGECSLRTLDLVMSFGERLNNQICTAYVASLGLITQYVDARTLVVTDDTFGNGQVDFAASYQRIAQRFGVLWGQNPNGQIAMVTGFIGANADGVTTTLGRNGSDYTASIFGAALEAIAIEIWTDVDGVLTCDPQLVPEAFVIPDLSVEEAMEMSYFGAEVLHPSTMIPAVEKRIPLWIKNTLNPGVRGTRIAKDVPPSAFAITGLAVIKDVALINVVGGGMIGAKGTASRIFSLLSQTGTNIIMISQASSEHSICIVARRDEARLAVENLRNSLAQAIVVRQIQEIQLVEALEIVAIIGANMCGRPGIAGKLFSALGAENINILAIAQGSSEMNISCVIASRDRTRALQSIHRVFFAEVTG
jgi:aspartokinase/homoserine dehydrogenase 1